MRELKALPVQSVLIESDWNLKTTGKKGVIYLIAVLIESDWNLKKDMRDKMPDDFSVLIESDWNLKFYILLI